MSQAIEQGVTYEQELIHRAINRDEDAYKLIWNSHSSRVLALADGIVHNMEDAKDIASEVCLKVWNALPSFRNESAFYTWVHRITINHAISFLQKRSRHNKIFESSDLTAYEHQPIEKTTPETVLNHLELRDLINQAIQNLPVKMQDVYILCEVKEMSYAEIATEVGCKIGTVMSRLNGARNRIRVFLKKKGFNL